MKGSFCGADRPLALIRKRQLVEFKKGSYSIGYCLNCEKEFETVHFNLQKGDIFYLFSDGYTNQFGGENVKKFNRQRFRNLLLSINGMPMDKQKKNLNCRLAIGKETKNKLMMFV